MAEKKVLDCNGLVLRITKVIGPMYPRFIEWVTKLQKGEVIEVYNNLFASLIPLDSLIQVLLLAIRDNWRNIHQISGPEDVNYYDIVKLFAHSLKCNNTLIKPIDGKLNKIGIQFPYMTLEPSKSVISNNIYLPETKTLITEWLDNYH